MREKFISWFGNHLANMIALKVSLGGAESTYLSRSQSFDQFCAEKHPECECLTEPLALEWIQPAMKSDIRAAHAQITFLRGFTDYLNRIGQQAYVIPKRFAAVKSMFVPYILPIMK